MRTSSFACFLTIAAAMCLANITRAGTSYPPLPYTDDFGNFNATMDDNGATFWKTIPGSLFTPNQVTEAGSNLVLVSDGSIGATLVGLDVSSTFNFFAAPLTFSVSGLDMSLSTAPASAQLFRFAVQDSGSITAAGDASSPTASGADAAVVIDITGTNHLALNLKEGNLAVANPLLNVTLQGAPTGFSLTLNGSAATPTYNLLVNEGTSSESFSGSLTGLTQANWGGVNEKGWSAISLASLDNGGGTGTFVNSTVGAVSVTSVPEPSIIVLLVGSLTLAPILIRRRSR